MFLPPPSVNIWELHICYHRVLFKLVYFFHRECVYSENINAKSHTFVMKWPDTSSKIPSAPSHITNISSPMLKKPSTSFQLRKITKTTSTSNVDLNCFVARNLSRIYGLFWCIVRKMWWWWKKIKIWGTVFLSWEKQSKASQDGGGAFDTALISWLKAKGESRWEPVGGWIAICTWFAANKQTN